MRHTLYLSSLLVAIWLLNSGHYTGLILALGVLSIAFVLWLAHKMDVVDGEAQPISLTHKLPGYWLWLFKEIIISNLDTVKRIWLAPHTIEPTIDVLPLSQKTDMGRVIYANSITLTPGTVTLDVDDNSVTVYALTKKGLDDLKEGGMDRRVSRLEH